MRSFEAVDASLDEIAPLAGLPFGVDVRLSV
jgi:hypothetical protein